MDQWLKGLIAAACAVIIVGGGYYGWREYEAAGRRSTAQARADSAAAERQRLAQLSPEACIRMAKETLPSKLGDPPRTTAHLKALNECDDMGRLDASWRQELDRFGIF